MLGFAKDAQPNLRLLDMKFRLFIAILMLVLIAPMLGGLLSYSMMALTMYFVGGSDFISFMMRAHEETRYDHLILYIGIFFGVAGGLLGIYFWRFLIRKTGIIQLAYIDKMYGRRNSPH
jgi:hypothetical protein